LKQWIIDVEFVFGSDIWRLSGGEGMAIYIVDKFGNYEEDWQHSFGYWNIFKGIAVYLNTLYWHWED